MSVTEYEWEFVRLSKYARERVPTEAKMCHKFEDGLNEDMKVLAGILELKEFVVLVERACRAEELMKEKKKAESEARDVRKRIMSRSAPTQSKKSRGVPPRSYASIGCSHRNRKKQGSSFRTQATSMASVDGAKPRQFECQHCGKRHPSPCRRNKETCFRCGSLDHFVRDCPELGEKLRTGRQSGSALRGRPLKNTGSRAGNKNTTREIVVRSEARTPVRAYAIRAREEASSPNVITGTFSFYDQDVIALIDPGSTHSYICMTLASSMNLLVDSTEFVIRVSNPLGKYVLVNKIYKKCALMIRVDCRRKVIELRHGSSKILRVESNESSGSPIESELKVESIPIVHDFADVFLEELPCLPPVGEVEFGIELMLETAPISISPYRMPPTELKELKSQLQELVDKGFVRPSFPLWGAAMLFVKKNDGSMRLSITDN
ncbi:uncharacterized protein LOC108474391 [Gossypium arboreum]|uniref:uncharacterized protein LOC108474391 n=1 Tax=Gossypium arboreum TaxID=29729 RepID=UPI0022F17B59|nr:uncharacterized protein LOC108474391 [Gossypium arboreum]